MTLNAMAQPAAAAVKKGMPEDLNLASMRVAALNTLYDFDFSTEQLKELKTLTSNTASSRKLTAAKPNAKLAQALKDYESGLLADKDAEAMEKIKSGLADLMEDAKLDDDVQPTMAALAKAPQYCKKIKASQIAAFLATHADEISDPVELMVGVESALRDMKADSAANSPADIAEMISETASSVSYLVCGADETRAKSMSTQISAWLKTGYDMSDTDYEKQSIAREESAEKLIGTVDPIQVLSNWLRYHIAQLMSNPELPGAIESILSVEK